MPDDDGSGENLAELSPDCYEEPQYSTYAMKWPLRMRRQEQVLLLRVVIVATRGPLAVVDEEDVDLTQSAMASRPLVTSSVVFAAIGATRAKTMTMGLLPPTAAARLASTTKSMRDASLAMRERIAAATGIMHICTQSAL